MSYTLNPLKWHNAAMNLVDQANRSNHCIVLKMAEKSGANTLAVCTGLCAATFLGMKFAASVPGCLLKNELSIIRLVTCDKREDRPYNQLPGVSDCVSTAKKALYQYLGVVGSLTGVLVVGSKFNAESQRKVGNCDKYESEIEEENTASLNALKPTMDLYIDSAVKLAQDPERKELMAMATGKSDSHPSILRAKDRRTYDSFVKRLVNEGVKKLNNEPNVFDDMNVECIKFLRSKLGRGVDLKAHEQYVQQKVIASVDRKLREESESIFQVVADARQVITDEFVKDNAMKLSAEGMRGYVDDVKTLVKEGLKKMSRAPNQFDQLHEGFISLLKQILGDKFDLTVHGKYLKKLINVYIDNFDKLNAHAKKEEEFLEFKRKTVTDALPSHVVALKGGKDKRTFWEDFDRKVNERTLDPRRQLRTPASDKAVAESYAVFKKAADTSEFARATKPNEIPAHTREVALETKGASKAFHELEEKLEREKTMKLAITVMGEKAILALDRGRTLKNAYDIMVNDLLRAKSSLLEAKPKIVFEVNASDDEVSDSERENKEKYLTLRQQEKFRSIVGRDDEAVSMSDDDEDVVVKDEESVLIPITTATPTDSTKTTTTSTTTATAPAASTTVTLPTAPTTTTTTTTTPTTTSTTTSSTSSASTSPSTPAPQTEQPTPKEESKRAWYNPMRMVDWFWGQPKVEKKEEAENEIAPTSASTSTTTTTTTTSTSVLASTPTSTTTSNTTKSPLFEDLYE